MPQMSVSRNISKQRYLDLSLYYYDEYILHFGISEFPNYLEICVIKRAGSFYYLPIICRDNIQGIISYMLL